MTQTVDFYTTGCPKCKVLEAKLTAKGLPYNIISDEELVIKRGEELGVSSAPFLVVNGKLLDFNNAKKWINEGK